MAGLLRRSRARGVPATFRSGGTSLSGQGITDSLLIDTRRHFRGIEVLDDGARVRVQPGATVRAVNARLSPYGRKLGPDPASEIACTVGGVIANNSSGMSCGTEFNTYQTVESMLLVLPSGTVLDTGAPDAEARLRALEPDLFDGLLRLRGRIVANPESVRTITRLFSMKNTMGYGLNSFLDFEDPVQILAHLMVGSEGTLGFVAEAVFRTVPVLPQAATGLLLFEDLDAAATALPDLVAQGLAAVELLDATSLRVAQAAADAPPQLRGLQVDRHAALLIEHQGADAAELAGLRAATDPLLAGLDLAAPYTMTSEARERARLWHMRKGLYTAVAGARPTGSNALLEDIVVPVPSLAATCARLSELFAAHRYQDSVIFGHAKDGNIHFMLNERFDDPVQLERYQVFTDEMVDLVLAEGGSLKAEHGTGRMMAPFVRRQYGDELYEVMCELKALLDPAQLLNPGVVINDDARSYILNLKVAPTVEAEVDRCVECGYCEPVCPSRDLTTTPRQRIVLRREIAAAEARGDKDLARRLQEDYDYEGTQTCAVDGMCVTACPVLINTGDLTRRLRREEAGPVASAGWRAAATGWNAATRAGGLALSAAKLMPGPLPRAATAVARAVLGDDTVPGYTPVLPRGGAARQPRTERRPDVVFFPACIGTMFGPAAGGEGAGKAFLEVCERAGVRVRVPQGIGSLCCGTPWKSKGFEQGYQAMAARVLADLWVATGGGELPVVCDAASCTEGLETIQRTAAGDPKYARLRFVDSTEFVREQVLPKLVIERRLPSLALHPTCSSTQLGANDALAEIAAALSDEVYVPPSWGCCAFAGDRGLLHPELTASATERQAAEINTREFGGYASVNRTCEIGMSKATGHTYRHILEYLAEATR